MVLTQRRQVATTCRTFTVAGSTACGVALKARGAEGAQRRGRHLAGFDRIGDAAAVALDLLRDLGYGDVDAARPRRLGGAADAVVVNAAEQALLRTLDDCEKPHRGDGQRDDDEAENDCNPPMRPPARHCQFRTA
jgi:hypothetical protein